LFVAVGLLIVFFLIGFIHAKTAQQVKTSESTQLDGKVTEVIAPSGVSGPAIPTTPVSGEVTELTNEENTSSGHLAEVIQVVDGDTLKVNLNGRVETIRVIGIDTPETVHPTEPVGCFGYEASQKAKELLTNTTVKVVTDEGQGTRDKYDRYLAYITLNSGKDFGTEMIRGGYAYEYTYDSAYQNQSIYKSAEVYARTNEIGLWAPEACGAVVRPVSPAASAAPSDDCTIKGNISYTTGEKIYHTLGQEDYRATVIDTTKGERWFCTESEAEVAGWRKALR
jgi:micrococcal nuclease